MVEYLTIKYGAINVYYTHDLDGGGNDFGRAYVPFMESRIGKQHRVLEWCAGPGFIGFSMLAAGLCDFLDLSDINPSSRAAIEKTTRDAALESRVRFHLSDCFDSISAELKWDLMVGNPPHANRKDAMNKYEQTHSSLIWKDADWLTHQRFYKDAALHLKPGGSVLLQENKRFSSTSDFRPMIERAGLEFVGGFDCGASYPDYYFVWSRLSER